MDISDQATAFEERDRDLALRMRLQTPAGPAEVGHCLNCAEPMPPGRRWCDADCRDDWQRELKAKNGH